MLCKIVYLDCFAAVAVFLLVGRRRSAGCRRVQVRSSPRFLATGRDENAPKIYAHETIPAFSPQPTAVVRGLWHHRTARRTVAERNEVQSDRPHACGRQCRAHLSRGSAGFRRGRAMCCAANAQKGRRCTRSPARRRHLSCSGFRRSALFFRSRRSSRAFGHRTADRCESTVHASPLARRNLRDGDQ